MSVQKPPAINVENVVASAEVGQELDLNELNNDLVGSQYDEDNFPGLVYRMQEPKSAALVFRSGNVVCTGAKGVNKVETAIEQVFSELEKLGIPVETPEPVIQNIVSGADLDNQLNLNAAAIGLGLEQVEYEPEQFPGLVYRPPELNVVILLFGSGKAVITGAQTVESAQEGVEVVMDELDGLGLLT
jgi:transcription initiation factor TFIID TATA-box-binding protein